VEAGFASDRALIIEERMILSPNRSHPRVKPEGMLWRIMRVRDRQEWKPVLRPICAVRTISSWRTPPGGRRYSRTGIRLQGQDVTQHPQVGWRRQVSRLREQARRGSTPIVSTAFPLKAAAVRGDRKAHAAFHGLDIKMGEQHRQIR
jgi:hypothetical protein